MNEGHFYLELCKKLKIDNIQCWQWYREIGTSILGWCENELPQNFWKVNWKFLLNEYITILLLWGIYSTEINAPDTCTNMLILALFIVAKSKQTNQESIGKMQFLINGWMIQYFLILMNLTIHSF